MINHTTIRLAPALLLALPSALHAQTNVDPANKHAWAENAGWLNWRDAGTPAGDQGVAIRTTHLEGYIWGENIGWINTGDGAAPYANTSNSNFGINIDPDGALWGYAWGENIGWINFDGGALASPPNPARLEGDRLRGYAWSENIGWINLDDANAFVAFTPACPGDLNNDGLINSDDLGILLAAFGTSPAGDIDNDGDTDSDDLGIILGLFGTNC
ncbi:MAG: hypothetical protein ACTS3F_12430 [Phycisphaerales bacterium]